MQPLKEESPSPPSTLFKSLLKFAYTIHFILSFCLVTFIIAKYPEVISASITFVMLVIYGYMGLWVLLVGFILVICKNHQKAVIFSRIVVKLIIICFPIFGLLSVSKDNELDNKYVHIFIIYMGIAALFIIVYELVSCLCYEEKHPEFLFAQNDLKEANDTVLEKRKQYNDHISSL